MKGIILAGGTGTRLRPMTNMLNKHLLPVGRYPMIHYAITKMVEAEISEIMLIIGKQSAGLFMEYLGSGLTHGVDLTYRLQEEAGGIAEALALAEGFIQPEEKLMMLLGDNLFEDCLLPAAQLFAHSPLESAMVFLKEVQDPSRYGVPVLSGDNIIGIEEKPSAPKSSYCVTGIYLYDSTVFDKIRSIKPSPRGELEITDVNNVYAAKGMLSYRILEGWWIDAGTHPSLLEASNRLS